MDGIKIFIQNMTEFYPGVCLLHSNTAKLSGKSINQSKKLAFDLTIRLFCTESKANDRRSLRLS